MGEVYIRTASGNNDKKTDFCLAFREAEAESMIGLSVKKYRRSFLETGHPADRSFITVQELVIKWEEAQTALPMREW